MCIDGMDATIDTSMAGNPSGRRSGLTVLFWCECCHRITRLDIEQHKGETHLTCIDLGPHPNVEGLGL
jgi:hypothetical protein